MASHLALNQEAPPPNSQEVVSDFFPFKHHFLNLQVNECKGQVNRVTCLLESCLSHHQVTSCTAPQSPCHLAWITRK